MEQSEKELVLGLLGSTFGELKKLDDSITGPSSTLGRRSDEIKLELQKMVKSNFTPPPAPPPPQPTAQAPQQPVFTATPPQVYVSIPKPVVEDNQLELDFDRKARYVEVVDELKVVSNRLSEIESKLDQIFEILSKSDVTPRVKRPYKKKEPVVEVTPQPTPQQVPQPELKKK